MMFADSTSLCLLKLGADAFIPYLSSRSDRLCPEVPLLVPAVAQGTFISE